jgi:hypothetical protein
VSTTGPVGAGTPSAKAAGSPTRGAVSVLHEASKTAAPRPAITRRDRRCTVPSSGLERFGVAI